MLSILALAQQAHHVQGLVLKTSLMRGTVTGAVGVEQMQVCLKGKLGDHQRARFAFVVPAHSTKNRLKRADSASSVERRLLLVTSTVNALRQNFFPTCHFKQSLLLPGARILLKCF